MRRRPALRSEALTEFTQTVQCTLRDRCQALCYCDPRSHPGGSFGWTLCGPGRARHQGNRRRLGACRSRRRGHLRGRRARRPPGLSQLRPRARRARPDQQGVGRSTRAITAWSENGATALREAVSSDCRSTSPPPPSDVRSAAAHAPRRRAHRRFARLSCASRTRAEARSVSTSPATHSSL